MKEKTEPEGVARTILISPLPSTASPPIPFSLGTSPITSPSLIGGGAKILLIQDIYII